MDGRVAKILVLVGAILYGFMGAHTRYLHEAGLTAADVCFVRVFITIAFVGIAMLLFHREWFAVKREWILLFLITGLCKASMDFSMNISLEHVSMGFSSCLQMTAPFFVMLLSYLLYKKDVKSYGIVAAIVCLIGTVLYSGVLFDEQPISLVGVLMGLISGFSMAAYMVVVKVLLEMECKPMTVVFYTFLVELLILIPLTDVGNTFVVITSSTELLYNAIALGVICTALPFLFDTVAQKHLDTTVVAILSTFEIVAAAVLGIILFNEYLDLSNIIGILLVILSIHIIGKYDNEEQKKMEMAENAS